MDETIEAIKKLENFNSLPEGVLTVCLSRDTQDSPSAKELTTLFHSLTHQNLSIDQKKQFRSDLEKAENYLRELFESRGTRSVVFISSGKNLWQVLEFEFPLPAFAKVANKPILAPLKRALKKHQKYMVLLVDREKARVFTVEMGKIVEFKKFIDFMVPQKVKAKKVEYGREDKIFRHIENHLDVHLQKVAEATGKFALKEKPRFIILGGHKELFVRVIKSLPYPYNKIVFGKFVTELNAPVGMILQKSKQAAEDINKRI